MITYDPDTVEKLSWQGEGNSFAWYHLARAGRLYLSQRARGHKHHVNGPIARKVHPTIDRRKEVSKISKG